MIPSKKRIITIKSKDPIILASSSPRRMHLLRQWGVKFKVFPSNINENTKLKNPSSIVKYLSLKKALSVAQFFKKGIIIGADTIVVLSSKIIGKPKNWKDAEKILSDLNGTFHKVYTGIAVVDAKTGKKKVGYELSRVKMRHFSKIEIKKLAGKHMDKAGAYAVQEKSDAFVERIEGDYFNVVGLPFKKLKCLLKKM